MRRAQNESIQPAVTRSLPVVSKAILRGVEREETDAEAANKKVFELNEEMSLYIRGRAIDLAGDNTEHLEDLVLLGSQVFLASSRQALANNLESLLAPPPA